MVVIFAGPSLRTGDRGLLDADYRPPAQLGSVMRAAGPAVCAIGLIDGYFESTPAVFHKEILWAMSLGIHVYGAASMGALRAAELAPHGMKGVGAVYELMRSGELEDDDEVAVLHGPALGGYACHSTAMVDIRHAIALATEAGACTADTARRILAVAKTLSYPERSYDTILALAAGEGDTGRLRTWLARNPVSLKATDAALLLRTIATDRAAGLLDRPFRTVPFEPTVFWERLVATERKHDANIAA